MDFVIDTAGDPQLATQPEPVTPQPSKERAAALKELLADYKQSLEKASSSAPKSADTFTEFYKEMGWASRRKQMRNREDIDHGLGSVRREVNDLLKKSVVTPDFEDKHSVPPYEVKEKKLREQRRKEREKTKGKKWYGLPATELTQEVKNDLEILQMRSILDPKRFYKKNDLKVLPKYFQVGKVLDSPLEYYNNRLTRKQRKKTLVDELLADAEFNKYNKRKYKEIIQEQQNTHYKAWRHAKKLKRKNKK